LLKEGSQIEGNDLYKIISTYFDLKIYKDPATISDLNLFCEEAVQNASTMSSKNFICVLNYLSEIYHIEEIYSRFDIEEADEAHLKEIFIHKY
jgi:hypothetical protein